MSNALKRPLESSDYVPTKFDPPPGLDMSEVLDSRQARLVLVHRPVASVGEREYQDEAAFEAFMNEMVVIQIHPTSDKNAPWVVPVGVNGDTRWLQRGRKFLIERKFLEVLSHFDMTYSTEENPDPRETTGMKTRTHAAQSYPFSVLYDPNPRGRGWLERITREGN